MLVTGHRRPFGYLASDAYYYLNIARNVLHHGRFAFDGVHSTNTAEPEITSEQYLALALADLKVTMSDARTPLVTRAQAAE